MRLEWPSDDDHTYQEQTTCIIIVPITLYLGTILKLCLGLLKLNWTKRKHEGISIHRLQDESQRITKVAWNSP